MLKIFSVIYSLVKPRNLVILLFILVPMHFSFQVIRKTKVNFEAEDGLIITADHYYSKTSNPYIILFHQEGSSRGEFETIANRFLSMNYNCLAVDLRSGGRYSFTENETAKLAREKGFSTRLYESLKDVTAAIKYIRTISEEPIALLGSSYSSSLSLIAASKNTDVKAVIAFSPGEFFLPEITVNSILNSLTIPVFAGCSTEEYPYVTDMFEGSENQNYILFKPSSGKGTRTAEALLQNKESSDEYWLALLIFIRYFL